MITRAPRQSFLHNLTHTTHVPNLRRANCALA